MVAGGVAAVGAAVWFSPLNQNEEERREGMGLRQGA